MLSGVAFFLLYSAHGFPTMTSEYAVKVIADSNTTKAFLGIALFISRAYVLPVLAVMATELTAFTPLALQSVREQLPRVQAQMQPLVARLVPSLANQDYSALISSVSEADVNSKVDNCTYE